MERLSGPDLDQLLTSTGKLSIADAIAYTVEAASGLQAAYEQGLIHCDVKPANLLLDQNGQLKVTDF